MFDYLKIGERCGVSDKGLEAPDADAAEQEMEVVPEDSETDEPDLLSEPPLEADPADAADQARRVLLEDDDDYR